MGRLRDEAQVGGRGGEEQCLSWGCRTLRVGDICSMGIGEWRGVWCAGLALPMNTCGMDMCKCPPHATLCVLCVANLDASL